MKLLWWTISGILGVGLFVLAGGAQALDAPTVTFPLNGQKVIAMPTLTWSSDNPLPTVYRVYLVGPGSGNANVLHCDGGTGPVGPDGCWFVKGETQLAVTTPLPLGPYTMYVESATPGVFGPWSAGTSFTVVPRFEDLGTTLLDHKTGLEWEKKTNAGDGSIHDWGTAYSWSTGTNNPDGTAFTVFLAGLNAGACISTSADGTTDSTATDCSFAGHSDWRLPKVSELMTIVDPTKRPTIDPIFGSSQSSLYWSSSSDASTTPQAAWFVNFNGGADGTISKTDSHYVRAVRSGP